MIDALIVLIVQTLFIFSLDHKYRFLNSGKIQQQILFQGIIATMYVFVIPMIAKGDIYSSLAYIAGSIAGTAISYKVHHRKERDDNTN